MSYEIVDVQGSRGTYTQTRPYVQNLTLLANDAAFLNIVVFVTSIVGGTATILLDESYDGGLTWVATTVSISTISTAGQTKFSPTSATILAPLVRLTILPSVGCTMVIDKVVKTRILSGVAVKLSASGVSGATEATLQTVLSEAQSIDTNTGTSALSLLSIDSKTPTLVGGAVPVVVGNFPSGGATETTLSAVNAKLPTLVSGKVPVDVTFPTGSATEAKQDSTITELTAIKNKLPTLGQQTEANSSPVVLTALQLTSLTGYLTDTQLRASPVPVTVPTGLATEAKQDTTITRLTSIDNKTATLVSGRVPVDIGASVLPTGAATEATLSALNTKVPALSLGAGAQTNALRTYAELGLGGSILSALNRAPTSAVVPHTSGTFSLTSAGQTNQVIQSTTNVASFGMVVFSIANMGTNIVEFQRRTGTSVQWFTTLIYDLDLQQFVTVFGNGNYAVSLAGATAFRMNVTSHTSGTVNVEYTYGELHTSLLPQSLHPDAATSFLQSAGNTTLSTINSKTPALGQQLAPSSSPVVLTAAQIATLTPQTNALTDAQLRASAVPVSFASPNSNPVQLVSSTQKPYLRDFGTTPLTTSYAEIIASTGVAINYFDAFNGTGEPIFLAIGAASSEVVFYIIPPGGSSTQVKMFVPAASRIAIKASANTQSSGLFILNAFE